MQIMAFRISLEQAFDSAQFILIDRLELLCTSQLKILASQVSGEEVKENVTYDFDF